MFKIDKEFDFCYGHRVHNQTLNAGLSDGKCKCRHLHGHNGKIKIGIEARELKNGMVTDFKHLGFFKALVDDLLDHKFIMDYNDPLLDSLFNGAKRYVQWVHLANTKYATIPRAAIDKIVEHIDLELRDATREKLEGLVVVDFVPTSENLCQFFADVASANLDHFLGHYPEQEARVSFVEFWETPKSHCRYEL